MGIEIDKKRNTTTNKRSIIVDKYWISMPSHIMNPIE